MRVEKGQDTPTQRPEAEHKPRNIYYVESHAALRVRFSPCREALAQELERRRLNRSQLARQGGVDLTTLQNWCSGKYVPQAKTFTRFLDGLGIDRPQEPYASFLANQGPGTGLCPDCQRVRLITRAEFRRAVRNAKGRLRWRKDGSYALELRCRPCSNLMKVSSLKRGKEQSLKNQFGPKVGYLLDAANAGDLDAQAEIRQLRAPWLGGTPEQRLREKTQRLERLQTARRRPRTAAHRLTSAVAGVVARAGILSQPFHLCPLCGRVTYAQRWHKPCWDTWRVWYQRNVGGVPKRGVLPPPLRKGGPNPEKHLARNYAWSMVRRYPKSRESRRQLLASGTQKPLKSKTTVTEGIKAFIRLLPGSWDLVFSEEPNVRRSNIARQELVPLPLEVQQLVGTDGRDPLIRHLLGYGMKEKDVDQLTGMGLPRVKGIAAGMKSSLAASA